MRATRKTWIGGTAFVCVVLCALAWFFLISPKRAETAQTVESTQQLASSNDVLAVQVSGLREQFERIDEFKTQLAEVQVKLPADLELSALLRELEATALSSGVVITEMTPADGQTVIPLEAASAEGADAESSSAEVVPEGLVAFPISVTLYGSYDTATAYVRAIQTELSRYMLVSATQVETQGEAPAAENGIPATIPGDVRIIMSGYVFVYPHDAPLPSEAEDSADVAQTAEGAEPAPLPTPAPGKNSFRELVPGLVPTDTGADAAGDENATTEDE